MANLAEILDLNSWAGAVFVFFSCFNTERRNSAGRPRTRDRRFAADEHAYAIGTSVLPGHPVARRIRTYNIIGTSTLPEHP